MGTFAQIFGGGTYSELIWAFAIVIILQVVLSFTRWGIYTVAVGGNRLGAAEAGINVRSGADPQLRPLRRCSLGSSGVFEAVRDDHRHPGPRRARTTCCSRAISAAVIGGTLLRGGAGTVVGALIGALFLGVLNDGLIIKGVERRTTSSSTSASRSSSR